MVAIGQNDVIVRQAIQKVTPAIVWLSWAERVVIIVAGNNNAGDTQPDPFERARLDMRAAVDKQQVGAQISSNL